MTLEEEKAEWERMQADCAKPKNVAKNILYRACSHAANDLNLNGDYMYGRIIKEQGMDWEHLI